MKNYDIWSEGYRISGGSGRAHFHGSSKGEDFKDACINFAKIDKEFNQYFNQERMTFWGCRLFDNHSDAAQSFG